MFNYRARSAAIVLAIASTMIATSGQADDAVLRDCASRDLTISTLIERRGEERALPDEAVVQAAMDQLLARRACREGRGADAVAIYAGLDARLAGTDGRR